MTETTNVIWLASYPKSGNTWLQSVLRQAAIKHKFPPPPLDVYDIQRERRAIPICPAELLTASEVPCAVLKTHSPYQAKQPLHDFEGVVFNNAAAIYVYRNPLDLLLSYINFTRMEYPRLVGNEEYAQRLFVDLLGREHAPDPEQWQATRMEDLPQRTLDHALGVYSESGLRLPTLGLGGRGWADHVRGWIEAGSSMRCVMLKYEDCLRDPRAFLAIREVFALSEEEVLSGVAHAKARSLRMSQSGTNDERVFYNRMEAYYYDKFFSTSAVRGFVDRHGQSLRELGYHEIVDRA